MRDYTARSGDEAGESFPGFDPPNLPAGESRGCGAVAQRGSVRRVKESRGGYPLDSSAGDGNRSSAVISRDNQVMPNSQSCPASQACKTFHAWPAVKSGRSSCTSSTDQIMAIC